MSPIQFHDHHEKKEIINASCSISPPSLRINKDSHFIKKSSASSLSVSSSSSSASSLNMVGHTKLRHRHPVIIYTHSPKIIHTHPKDFMALVQKLTGLSRSEEAHCPIKTEDGKEENRNPEITANDDTESSSVITDENCGNIGESQVNSSCFVRTIFEPSPNPNYLTNIPVFTPNSSDFLCSNPQFYNYTDSLFFNPTMRNSFPSTSTLEGINELHQMSHD
ncbi:VQ domain-containing protein [Cephalotus follicularis]|uniref:VQ domain-containing protein n=1 Tax=Cephalotus follicularis TaxID=3775 RepID=A0A1Q3C636_CEPFO|nr:VQ domain-containing protein [Cephalotus follicularis]